MRRGTGAKFDATMYICTIIALKGYVPRVVRVPIVLYVGCQQPCISPGYLLLTWWNEPMGKIVFFWVSHYGLNILEKEKIKRHDQ